MADLVETFFKKRTRSRQRQRALDNERQLVMSKRIVAARAGGRCEVPNCLGRHEHTHHKAGRTGEGAHHPDRLLACCLPCHEFIHAHPAWAREQGLMESRTT